MTTPVRLLPVLAQRRRRRRGAATSRSSPSARASEIEELDAAVAERPAAREAQRALAYEVTSLVHGADAADAGRGGEPGAVRPGRAGRPRRRDARGRAWPSCPSAPGARRRRRSSTCSPRPGVVASKGAARRAIAEGGAYVNNVRVADRGRRADRRGPAARPLGGPAPRQAHPRRGRRAGLSRRSTTGPRSTVSRRSRR